jgi:hypothetical protein
MRTKSLFGLDPESLQVVLALLWIALVTWAWGKYDIPWEVAALGWVAGAFGLVEFSLRHLEYDVALFFRLLRRVRTEWRNFRRR